MPRTFHTLVRSIATLIPLLLLAVTPIAQAQNRTVDDYFLQMPEQYLKIFDRNQVPVSVRQKLLKQSHAVVDRSNGYLSTSSIAPDLCNYEMAIFRRDRGSHLVAFNLVCTSGDTLTILDPDRDWANVTAGVFPTQFLKIDRREAGPFVNLPRYGRTIKIKDHENNPIANVTFDGQQFDGQQFKVER